MFKTVLVVLSLAVPAFAAEATNWSGPYQTCVNKNELLKATHMDLGVRIDTANSDIAAAFRRALAFWAGILDMSYHEEASSDCALALVDGTPEVLQTSQNVARAQFVDFANFQAWIAFDPHASQYMSAGEIYATAVHELGHLFGLRHNPRAHSIMYFLDCDATSTLDAADLQSLALHHALRVGIRSEIPIIQ